MREDQTKTLMGSTSAARDFSTTAAASYLCHHEEGGRLLVSGVSAGLKQVLFSNRDGGRNVAGRRNNRVLITEPFNGVLKFYMSRSVI